MHAHVYTETFTQRSLYTGQFLHRTAFARIHRSFKTQPMLHRAASTQNCEGVQLTSENLIFTANFDIPTLFCAKGCSWCLKIAILRQFFQRNHHFMRKAASCNWRLNTAILHNFWHSALISRERVELGQIRFAFYDTFWCQTSTISAEGCASFTIRWGGRRGISTGCARSKQIHFGATHLTSGIQNFSQRVTLWWNLPTSNSNRGKRRAKIFTGPLQRVSS